MNKIALALLLVIAVCPVWADNTIAIHSGENGELGAQSIKNLLMRPISQQSVQSQQAHQPDLKPHVVPMQASDQARHNQVALPKVKTTTIEINHELIRNIPVSADYSVKGPNYISATGVNALVFPVKIASFTPEPGSMSFKWASDNHAIVFKLTDPNMKSVQAIVTLDNTSKEPISLVFDVINSSGRVIAVPASIAGTSPLADSPLYKNSSNYEAQIIQLMNQAINNQPFSSAWQFSENTDMKSPYSQFTVPSFEQWTNPVYTLKDFTLCSRDYGELHLKETDYANANTVAVTLTKFNLWHGECTQLVVLQQNPASSNTSGQDMDMLSPVNTGGQ